MRRAHHGVGEAGGGQLQLADVAGEAEAGRLPGPEAEVDDHVPAGEFGSIWKLQSVVEQGCRKKDVKKKVDENGSERGMGEKRGYAMLS